MKKFLLSLLCAFVALGANALTVVDIYKDFTTTQNVSWGSDAANARISFSSTNGLVYSSTTATANNWDAQYWVANGNTFSPSYTYTLTMMIKGSVAGTIGNIKLGDWDQGVDNYGKFNIPAGEFKEVSIKVSGVPGGDGVLLQTGSYVGELCIKWIKVTHEEASDENLLNLALTNIPAGTNVWDHALEYDFDPVLPAGNYTLSLDVKGDAAGSMNIWGNYDVEGAYYGPVINFGTEWAKKIVDFSLAKDFKLLRLVFGEYKGSSLYFDNIKITNKATGEEVVFADFSSGTLEGFKVAGFWTNNGGWVEHKADAEVVEKEAYTISTAVGKIGTIALDYPAIVEGAKLYEVVSFDTTEGLAVAEVVGDMVGGTPYIYLATADEVVCTKAGDAVEHGDFNCTKSSVGNGLTGCYEEVTSNTWWFGFIKNNAYVISGGKLRQIANGNVTIPANRCFFNPANCTNQSSSAKMVLSVEGATKINNVNAALEGGKIYDINGREVQSMKKGGIYIVGGMKVSVK